MGPSEKVSLVIFCDKERIRREVIPPHFPQYNGCLEREIAMLEATAFAAQRQAKNLGYRGLVDEALN